MGLKLFGEFTGLPFFSKGVIIAVLHRDGRLPSFQVLFIKDNITSLDLGPRCFNISLVMLSGPGAFLFASFFRALFSSYVLKGSSKAAACPDLGLWVFLKSASSNSFLLVVLETCANVLFRSFALHFPLVTRLSKLSLSG